MKKLAYKDFLDRTVDAPLENARSFIKNNESFMQKPSIHIAPAVGNMGRPTSFVYYEGEYHVFAETWPYNIIPGASHWMYTFSDDLTWWKSGRVAFAPGKSGDDWAGIGSGSVFKESGSILFAYTASNEILNGKESEVKQTIKIVRSHLETFKRIDEITVGAKELSLKDADMSVFRHPKIWREEGIYYMLVSHNANKKPTLQLFKSKNLKKWERISTFLEPNEKLGKIYESPDYFKMNGKEVILLTSPEMARDGNKFSNPYSSVYLVGSSNGKKFTTESITEIDWGIDFMAPITTVDETGRRLMIARANMLGLPNWAHLSKREWYGMLTLPRLIRMKLETNKIVQTPPKEVYESFKIKSIKSGAIFEARQVFENPIRFAFDTNGSFTFRMHIIEDEYVDFSYNASLHKLTFDRKHTLLYSHEEKVELYRREIIIPGGVKNVDIFLDKTLVEIFTNDGEQAGTFQVYSKNTGLKRVQLESEGKIEFKEFVYLKNKALI